MNHQLFITKRHLDTTDPSSHEIEVDEKLEVKINSNAIDPGFKKEKDTNKLAIYLKTRLWGSFGNLLSFDYEGISLTDFADSYSIDKAQENLLEIVRKEIYPDIYESLRKNIEKDIKLAGYEFFKLPSVHTLKDEKVN